MALRLFTPSPPNLPLAPKDYEAQHQDKLANTLRLFFNQIRVAFEALLGRCGQIYLNAPFGAFQDNTTQTAAAANTAYAVTLGTTDASNQISVVSSSRVTVVYAGIYNFQFSAQVARTGGASNDNVYIWARINGVDVADSATRVTVQGAGSDLVAAWNFVLTMQSGDYFELMWSVTDTRIQLVHYATVAPAPGIPSVILTATYVSNIPA